MSGAFELILSDEVQSLIDHFAALLDLRITFFSVDGHPLRRGREMRNSNYCEIVQQELCGIGACHSMDSEKRAEAEKRKNALDYQCHAGLREVIAPIYLHGRLAGFLMIGQFRVNNEVPQCMLARCRNIDQRARLSEAFYALPLINPEKLEDVLGLFRMLIDYIALRELAVLQGDKLRYEIDRYLEQNCMNDVRLPEMARKLGRSVSSISQFLRRNYNTSFKELLIERRLTKAEDYFRANPEATVGEAAFAAGFNDPFYFSRLFRKRKGVPPAEYRDQLRRKRHSP